MQSPWAYSFVRYVINEHCPYYGYDRLRKEFPDATACMRKTGFFYLRLANFSQPLRVVSLHSRGDACEKFRRECFLAGCKRTEYELADEREKVAASVARRSEDGAITVCCGASAASADFVSTLAGQLRKGDFILIEDIGGSKASRRAWKELRDTLTGVLMFDLFYCGVIYVDPDRYKQHFRINF